MDDYTGDRPGDDYNRRVTREEVRLLLAEHDWTVIEHRDGIDYLRRPGKSSGMYSASLGYLKGNRLKVFTTSDPTLQPKKGGYQPFALYALLKHAGDFKAATKVLVDLGYGRNGQPSSETGKAQDETYHTGANGDSQQEPHQKPMARPRILHAEEITEQPMQWLWEPYLPRNMLVMLDGDPGLGKSMMLLQVAANLSQGQPFLDQLGKPTLTADVEGPQNTLILSAEDSLEHIMVPRLKRACADLKRIKFLDGWLSPDGRQHTFTLQHIPILVRAIEQVKPVLVILDRLVAYLGDIDMHRSNQTGR